MRAASPLLASLFVVGCYAPPLTPQAVAEVAPPCFSTLCEPGGVQIDDDTLAGGVPVATKSEKGLVFAWEDLGRVVVATLPFVGSLETTIVEVPSRGRVAIAASGEEAAVFRSDRERNIAFIKDGSS